LSEPSQKIDLEKRRIEVAERRIEVTERRQNEENQKQLRKELMLIKWELVRKKRAELLEIQERTKNRRNTATWWVNTAFKHMLVKKF